VRISDFLKEGETGVLPLQFELAHFDVDRHVVIPRSPKPDKRWLIRVPEEQFRCFVKTIGDVLNIIWAVVI
jgi:hypothetical protein